MHLLVESSRVSQLLSSWESLKKIRYNWLKILVPCIKCYLKFNKKMFFIQDSIALSIKRKLAFFLRKLCTTKFWEMIISEIGINQRLERDMLVSNAISSACWIPRNSSQEKTFNISSYNLIYLSLYQIQGLWHNV